MEPHDLVARYYQETHNTPMPGDLLARFRTLHEEVLLEAD
jgi:hypothetical protein